MNFVRKTLLLVTTSICFLHATAQQLVQDAKHTIVYHQPERFAGWPANHHALLYDENEILVGFTEATYKKSNSHNAIKPFDSWQARSIDGGISWQTQNPINYAGDFGDVPALKQLDKPIDFKHPQFGIRVIGASYHGADDARSHFFLTYDKGVSWQGPYSFGNLLEWPEFKNTGLNELSPRTDYVITGSKECIFIFSIRTAEKFGSDRLFCIQTKDGGQSFQFLGWIIPPANVKGNFPKVDLFDAKSENPYANECRAVMSQTKRLKDGTLISVIRRKYVTSQKLEKHWLDAYQSKDGGKSWQFLSYIADTGGSNGNPPAFNLTKDGRLAVVYGERDHGTIRVQYSNTKGRTWSKPQILMDGFWSEDMELNDLGYPRLFTRKDGKLVAVYYYSTKEALHHLRATVWQP